MATQYYMLSNMPIMYFRVKGKATLKDLREVEMELKPRLNARRDNLHLLIDVSEMDGLGIELKHLKQAIGLTHPRIGKVVLFGGDFAVRSLLTILARFTASDRLRYFGNEADAMTYLQRLLAEAGATSSDETFGYYGR
ncbi:MAG: STAS/SEC14 domain-containing protein [Chloroflexota bacterium]|nr:STAS/SEC14 domain-containing protein [Chloroflexota bacterium]